MEYSAPAPGVRADESLPSTLCLTLATPALLVQVKRITSRNRKSSDIFLTFFQLRSNIESCIRRACIWSFMRGESVNLLCLS